jgi:hypothetical protein
MSREYAPKQEPSTVQKSVDRHVKKPIIPDGFTEVTTFCLDGQGILYTFRADGSIVKVGG